MHKKDTIGEIFEAPDADELIEWLRHQSIMIETEDAVFVHAGVHPLWTLEKARGLAREAEAVLSGPDWKAMLQQMYGNSDWDDGLKGGERMQAILNCFTRMRFVDKKTAELDFKQKEDIGSAPKHLIPWFEYSKRPMAGTPICFGHWSMLGLIRRDDIVAIGQKAAFFTGATHMLNMIEGGPWWGHGGVRSLALALAAAAREPVDVDRIISVKGYGCNGCC